MISLLRATLADRDGEELDSLLAETDGDGLLNLHSLARQVLRDSGVPWELADGDTITIKWVKKGEG